MNRRAAADDDDSDTSPLSRTRQRTSSVTSIETIRLKVKTRVAEVLQKPRPLLAEVTTIKRSARKRTLSATSPEGDDDDPSALPTGPRVRQRRDSGSLASTASDVALGNPKSAETANMQIGTPPALKKLKEKLTPVASTEASDAPPESRSAVFSKCATDNSADQLHTVVFPSKHTIGTGTTRLKEAQAPADEDRLSPMPLRSLSTNTPRKRPLPTRLPIPGARLSKYGCYELSATELSLSVTFPAHTRANFEVWDQEDDLFLVGPVALRLALKDPAKWAGLPLSHPDIAILDLRCASTATVPVEAPAYPYPYCAAAAASSVVRYLGAKTRSKTGAALPLPLDASRGITVDEWLRTYEGMDGQSVGETARKACHGWELQFFVPVATRLFEKRETRAFRVDARIAVFGEVLTAESATMSVSHLMRAREMVRHA